jgi:hypothetical protein
MYGTMRHQTCSCGLHMTLAQVIKDPTEIAAMDAWEEQEADFIAAWEAVPPVQPEPKAHPWRNLFLFGLLVLASWVPAAVVMWLVSR